MSQDSINISVFETTEEVGIVVTPNITTVNVQQVTNTSLVKSVNGQTGDVVIPTSDNNFTTVLKNKLDGIETGAEVNVNADWNATSGDAQILNKPTIPAPVIVDSIPTDGSSNAVSSNGVFDALATKQNSLPALTNGSVLFSNGTTIAQDNANLFWDNTNKRLGVGTNAPAFDLEVSRSLNSTYAAINIRNTSVLSNATTVFRVQDNSTGVCEFGLGGTGHSTLSNVGYFFTSKSILDFYANSGNRMRIFGLTGNVLIQNAGTFTDAGFRLDVNGTTRLNGNTSIGGATAGARLDVRAQGALSTDIAFRVRNSADTADLFLTRGSGDSFINTLRIGKGSNNLSENTIFGFESGRSITTGNFNTLIGFQTGATLTTGRFNTFVGRNSGVTASEAINNTFVGSSSGQALTTGIDNTSLGCNSLSSNLTGQQNVAIGSSSLKLNSSSFNTALGFKSGEKSTGLDNTLLGCESMSNLTTGNYNVSIGSSAGRFISGFSTINTLCSNSIFIGRFASPLSDNQTNQIVIGYEAVGLGSNTVVLGNNSIITTALKGNVGIGTTVPVASAQLQIDSTTKGFLPPRMTNAQRLAIASPAIGLIVYCTDMVEGLYVNKSTGWTFII
jgi:hypothetical protein